VAMSMSSVHVKPPDRPGEGELNKRESDRTRRRRVDRSLPGTALRLQTSGVVTDDTQQRLEVAGVVYSVCVV
jgi:hypothetical protein